MQTFKVVYQLHMESKTEEFEFCIDESSMVLVSNESIPQDWQRLEFNQCPNCPLDQQQHEYCPVARNLSILLDSCDVDSFTETKMVVVTDERTISIDTTMQRALSSMLGLVIATSGCPHTLVFKPMARFHLPGASDMESLVRSVSMYLLRQYIAEKHGEVGDFHLTKFADLYNAIHIINMHLAKRVKEACQSDAAVNGLVLLDLLTKTIPLSIDDALEEIVHLFEKAS